MLHEAAPRLGPCSRGQGHLPAVGRWHNARFKALAKELDIEVAKDPRIGVGPSTTIPATTIPATTRDAYAVR